ALLAGVAVSPEWLMAVGQVGQTPQGSRLTPVHAALAGAVADRILPRTDTPGAADVGVPAFIDLLYAEFMTPDERQMLAAGLASARDASTTARRDHRCRARRAPEGALLHLRHHRRGWPATGAARRSAHARRGLHHLDPDQSPDAQGGPDPPRCAGDAAVLGHRDVQLRDGPRPRRAGDRCGGEARALEGRLERDLSERAARYRLGADPAGAISPRDRERIAGDDR